MTVSLMCLDTHHVQVSNVVRLTNFKNNCLVIWNGTMPPSASDTLQDRSRFAFFVLFHLDYAIENSLVSMKEPQITNKITEIFRLAASYNCQ